MRGGGNGAVEMETSVEDSQWVGISINFLHYEAGEGEGEKGAVF